MKTFLHTLINSQILEPPVISGVHSPHVFPSSSHLPVFVRTGFVIAAASQHGSNGEISGNKTTTALQWSTLVVLRDFERYLWNKQSQEPSATPLMHWVRGHHRVMRYIQWLTLMDTVYTERFLGMPTVPRARALLARGTTAPMLCCLERSYSYIVLTSLCQG